MREEDLHDTLRAIRELTHASCHLANLAARLTRDAPHPDAVAAAEAAFEASLRAAEGAFTLDDAFRSGCDSAAVLWLALEALETSQHAIRASREAVEAALAVVMAAPAQKHP